jgi:hypothetical protein
MNGEAWSCFKQLPSGLIDPHSASLTLNWLRPRPTHAGFKLTAADVDEVRHARMARLQRWSLVALAMLLPVVGGAGIADDLSGHTLIADPGSRAVAIFVGVASVAAAASTLIWTGLALLRYQQAALRLEAFRSARVEFEGIDAWRAMRCDAAFWDGGVDETSFERECAELLAGHFGTGQVMMTRTANDYGVDVLICSPQEKIVAQCKPWINKVGAAQVRALAGSKAFFGADRAVLMTIVGPLDDGEQARDFAQRLRLELWDVTRIVAAATALRRGI